MFGQGLNFGGLIGTAAPNIDFLVVAGGGSGAVSHGGGGGAGGLRTSFSASGGGSSAENSFSASLATPYLITVGDGGTGVISAGANAAGNNGSDSVFATITSIGGGGGSAYAGQTTPGDGGSGGGGGNQSQAGGIGQAGEGFNGGTGSSSSTNYPSGGGGGAGTAGGNGSGSTAGNGGAGLAVSITGFAVDYAGGAGGSTYLGGTAGTGGIGGGANGTNSNGVGNAGTVNTGGGGSGATSGTSGAGGSGIVILRYPTAEVSSYAVTGTLDTVANTAYPVANTAYYKLNGGSGTTVTDSSGNGYNGTATSVTYSAGRFGQASVFNGSSSKIEISGLSTFLASSSSKSWSCWVKTTSTGNIGNRAIISDYGNGVGAFNFDCFLTPVDGKVYLVSNAGGVYVYILSSATINNGVWHHICAVQNTTTNTLELYIDSNSQGTISIGTGTRTSPLFIGTYGVGYFWDGQIDQARVFNSAISAANVTSLYNESTVVESTDGTDSILQFTGGSGDITFS